MTGGKSALDVRARHRGGWTFGAQALRRFCLYARKCVCVFLRGCSIAARFTDWVLMPSSFQKRMSMVTMTMQDFHRCINAQLAETHDNYVIFIDV